ncbi:unnamed protein product [Caenorhabditis nigoni]
MSEHTRSQNCTISTEVHTDTLRTSSSDTGPDQTLNTLKKLNLVRTEERQSNSERYLGKWTSTGSNGSLRAAAVVLGTLQNKENAPKAEASSPITPPTVRQMTHLESHEVRKTHPTVRHQSTRGYFDFPACQEHPLSNRETVGRCSGREPRLSIFQANSIRRKTRPGRELNTFDEIPKENAALPVTPPMVRGTSHLESRKIQETHPTVKGFFRLYLQMNQLFKKNREMWSLLHNQYKKSDLSRIHTRPDKSTRQELFLIPALL